MQKEVADSCLNGCAKITGAKEISVAYEKYIAT